MLLAELASCQVEYKYLAKATGRFEYYEKVCLTVDNTRIFADEGVQAENVMTHLYAGEQYHGLMAERWYLTGKPTNSK